MGSLISAQGLYKPTRLMARSPRRHWSIVFCLLAGLVGRPIVSHAHAVVTHATLKDGTVTAGAPSETTLEFNSAIEAKLAKVTLVDDKGAERTLELAAGEHPANVLVVSLPALTPGHYALRYKVLAADGHVTESVLRFQVTESK
jgi:methionine-rich copper-binding protein CopC